MEMSDNNSYTDFLFPKTSFAIGAGTVMNLAGNFYDFNASETPAAADEIAIANDWAIIGNDMSVALQNYSDEVDGK